MARTGNNKRTGDEYCTKRSSDRSGLVFLTGLLLSQNVWLQVQWWVACHWPQRVTTLYVKWFTQPSPHHSSHRTIADTLGQNVVSFWKSWKKLTRMSDQRGLFESKPALRVHQACDFWSGDCVAPLASCRPVSRKAMAASPAVTAPISFYQDAMQWAGGLHQGRAERETSGEQMLHSPPMHWVLCLDCKGHPSSPKWMFFVEKVHTAFDPGRPLRFGILHCACFVNMHWFR